MCCACAVVGEWRCAVVAHVYCIVCLFFLTCFMWQFIVVAEILQLATRWLVLWSTATAKCIVSRSGHGQICKFIVLFWVILSFLGRLRRVDLIRWVSDVVRHTSVRPSTKRFSDSDEIWYVGRGRWVMHDGMPYDPIQGQGQGHETFKVRNSSIFQNLSPPPFLMWAGKWPLILKLQNNI